MNPTTYALDNDHAASRSHHDNLAALMDPGTRDRIQQLPVWGRASRCLEIGAGGGSISHWLADRMPPDGSVTALDLKPEPIGTHPRLIVVAHNLCSPIPLTEVVGDQYDLIVARMVLIHLPDREPVLHRLARLLAPGGTMLVEDWVLSADSGVVIAPSPEDAQLWERFRVAITDVFAAAGADRCWGLRVWPTMHTAGLTDLDTQIRAEYWPGGHPGLRLVGTSTAQLAPRLLEAGLSTEELARIRELTEDPQMVVHGHPMYSTSGTRP